jgi:hypothetical protein
MGFHAIKLPVTSWKDSSSQQQKEGTNLKKHQLGRVTEKRVDGPIYAENLVVRPAWFHSSPRAFRLVPPQGYTKSRHFDISNFSPGSADMAIERSSLQTSSEGEGI